MPDVVLIQHGAAHEIFAGRTLASMNGCFSPDLIAQMVEVESGSVAERDVWDGASFSKPLPPTPTADDIRAEAQRRIVTLTGARDLQSSMAKQLNALMRATELTNAKASGVTLSPEEEAEAAALQAIADRIKVIRAASNRLEASLPVDFRDDRHWA